MSASPLPDRRCEECGNPMTDAEYERQTYCDECWSVPEGNAQGSPFYDREKRAWAPRCPHGDVCSGCDARGYCTRAETGDDSPFHDHPLYLFISEGSLVDPSADSVKAMYRLACRSCGEAFEEGETPVPSRSIRGNPLVHAECSE